MRHRLLAIAGAAASLAACSGNNAVKLTPQPPPTAAPTVPISSFATLTTIGSTVDTGTGAGAGDSNPYGLVIANTTAGNEVAGDLLVCNFNDASASPQGNGTTIEQLSPTPGSAPVRFAQSASFQGCDALALSSGGAVYMAAYTANDDPVVSTSGTVISTLSQNTWQQPWGQAFNAGTGSAPTYFETNAGNGTVTRIHVGPGPSFTFDTLLSGLTTNQTNGILAPTGLTYDATTDSLYVVDSNANRVLEIANATTAPANSYAASGMGFTSPAVSVLYSGAPLNAPISSAMLADGDLVVGNTGDNLLMDIKPRGKFDRPSVGVGVVGTKVVDTGGPGAIFGIATTTSPTGAQYIYFNDDNTNTVVRLSP